MTSPALQEVVAVLASPAAGNPSQYLFERAIERAGLDARQVAQPATSLGTGLSTDTRKHECTTSAALPPALQPAPPTDIAAAVVVA